MDSNESYVLLWSEEFDGAKGTQINPREWNFNIGDGSDYQIPGWGNQEREYYTDQSTQLDGKSNLVIQANRKYVSADNHEYNDSELDHYMTYYGTPAEWLSGKITTFQKLAFQYGRIEARLRVPEGIGTWPAFWMLGYDIQANTWPHCGEIDIIETRGDMPTTIFSTLHGPGYSGEEGKGLVLDTGLVMSDDFHVIAIEWYENEISWFLDGNQCLRLKAQDLEPLTWVYNKPFYLIVNLAMGGNFTGAIDPEVTEATFAIDYIRYYSIDGIGTLYRDNEIDW